jgi:hypothetical protein
MLSSEIQLEYGVCGLIVNPVLLALNPSPYMSEFRVGTGGVADVRNLPSDDCQPIHLERGVMVIQLERGGLVCQGKNDNLLYSSSIPVI